MERRERQKAATQIATDLQSLLKRSQMWIDGTVDEPAENTAKAASVESISVQNASVPSATPSDPIATTATVTAVEGDRMLTDAVGRLFRIQKVARKPPPVYTLIDEHRSPKGGREFVIEIECNGETARGIGLNKRKAKRVAARNILMKMEAISDNSSTNNNHNTVSAFKESSANDGRDEDVSYANNDDQSD